MSNDQEMGGLVSEKTMFFFCSHYKQPLVHTNSLLYYYILVVKVLTTDRSVI